MTDASDGSNSRGGTRREFLKRSGVIAGAAALTAHGVRAAATPAAAHRSWERQADVLVVGSGAAALSAAIAVVRAGSSVIIVEKAPTVGGTSEIGRAHV